MYKLSGENFEAIEKYIVSKGENYNQDRCIVVQIETKDVEVTCCIDEIENELRVCQVNGVDANPSIGMIHLTELLSLSNKASYNSSEEEKYKDYIEVIKMETECCKKCWDCCSIKFWE